MKKQKKEYLGTTLMFIGALLIIISLGMIAYNTYEDYQMGKASNEILDVLTNEIPEESEDIPLYKIDPDIEMTSVEIDGNYYVGKIEIPNLNISLPVHKEWNYANLKTAPCRYQGTPYKDGFIVFAHNSDSHFGRINTLEIGSIIIFTDMDGNVFKYEVVEKEQLLNTDIEDMINTDYPLTIFTCTIGGQYRITVRCDRVEE